MVKMTDIQCARCTNFLAVTNANKFHLCGKCQADLGPAHSPVHEAWVARGMLREVDRTGKKPKRIEARPLQAASRAELKPDEIEDVEVREVDTQELKALFSEVGRVGTLVADLAAASASTFRTVEAAMTRMSHWGEPKELKDVKTEELMAELEKRKAEAIRMLSLLGIQVPAATVQGS